VSWWVENEAISLYSKLISLFFVWVKNTYKGKETKKVPIFKL
jgi:hypothetical protein